MADRPEERDVIALDEVRKLGRHLEQMGQWLRNLPTPADIDKAREDVRRPGVQEAIRQIREREATRVRPPTPEQLRDAREALKWFSEEAGYGGLAPMARLDNWLSAWTALLDYVERTTGASP